MVDVTTSIVIDCPIKKVFAYVTDPETAPSWYANIKSVTWKTKKPLKVGSRFSFTAVFLGREFSYVYEVVRLHPGKMLVMRTAHGPFLMETSYTFEQIGEMSRVTLRNRGSPAGFSRLLLPFMAIAMRIANNKDLRTVKRILER